MKISVCHLLLPLLILLFCCQCLTAVHGNVDTDHYNQHSIYKTYTGFNPKRSKEQFLTTNSSRADFPCPASDAIVPCTCSFDANNRVYLNCTFVESVDQLVEVFQQSFPVKELYQFIMANNSAINWFPSFMNGITFESVYLNPGPFTLTYITEHFFFDLKDTLKELVIYQSKLTTDFFPFFMLPSMNQLENLGIYFSDINWIPQIRAPKLTLFALEHSPIEILENGTFSIGTGPMTIFVHSNQIHTIEVGSIFFADQSSADSNEQIRIDVQNNQLQSLKAGTFPLRNGLIIIYLYGNQISSIEPGTFVLPASTDSLSIDLHLYANQLTTVDEAVFGNMMPFITHLDLRSNPLICGCDMAWLILNEAFMTIVDDGVTCADGTNIHALDPQQYIDFC